MELNQLQAEVGAWATENFGDQPPAYALVGASEEIGELSEAYLDQYRNHPAGVSVQIRLALELQAAVGMLNHSILKRTQGIRQDEAEVGPEAEVQALKRIQRITEQIGEIHDHQYHGRETDLDQVPEPSEELVDSVADTVIYLNDFSERAGIDLDAAVSDTWNGIVSERDWDSDLGDHDA